MADNSANTVGSKGGKPTSTSSDTSITKGGEGQFGGLGPTGGQQSTSSFSQRGSSTSMLKDDGNNFDSGKQSFDKPSSKPSENYGYSGGVVVSDTVKSYSEKNPDGIDFSFKGRSALQRERNSEAKSQGGVETPQSKELGSKYSWTNLSGKSENIGGKIFTNQVQFTRDSTLEKGSKTKEASRADGLFVNKANADYSNPKTDTTFGGVKTPASERYGNVFGWQGKSQNVRNTPQEEAVKSDQAKNASQIYPNNEKSAFFASTPSSSSAKQVTVFSDQKSTPSETPSLTPAELFASAEKNNASGIAVFDKNNNLLGIVKPNQKGLDFVNQIANETGYVSLRERVSTGQSSVGDLSFIGSAASKGAVISVFDQNGKPLGQASGSNAQLTFEKILSKSGGKVTYSILYPEAEKEILSSAKQNPSFFEGLSNSYYQNAAKSGYISSKGMESLNSIFKEDYFVKNSNPAIKSTLDKSTTPMDIVNTRMGVYHGEKRGNEIVGEPAYQGHYVDTSIAKNGLPNFINQELEKTKTGLTGPVSVISPWIKYEEFGKNFAAFFTQGAKSTAIVGTALATEGYSLIRTGKATDKTIAPNPSAFLSGVYYPQDLWSAKATENSAKAQSLIHSVAKPIGVSGIVPVENAQTFGATAGTLAALGLTVYGMKSAVPLRVVERPISFQKSTPSLVFTELGKDVTSQPIRPSYKGLAFGYGGPRSYELVGRTASGQVKFGKPSIEQSAPIGYRPVVTSDVGFEASNRGSDYSIHHSTNPELFSYLSSTGRTVQPNAGELMGAIKIVNKSGMEVPSRPPAREISAGETSSPVVDKSLMEKISTRQGIINIFKVRSGGRAKEVYGSNISAATLSERGLKVMNEKFPSQDVDLAKGGKGEPNSANPINRFVDAQREPLAKTIHGGILQGQGLVTNSESGLHGTDIKSARDIMANGVDLSARKGPTEGFFLGNENTLPEGYATRASERTGNAPVIMKLGLAKDKILSFSKLSGKQKKKVTTNDWEFNQANLEAFAKSKGKQGATHPYDNPPTKNSRFEKVIYSPKVITSAEIIPDYQLTSLQGTKVGTTGKTLAGKKVAEEGKIFEIPSHLSGSGSSKSSGKIFDKEIEQKTLKYKIKGSNRTIKGASENFQFQTQMKKIGTLQTKESLAQQGGTTAEQRAIIGDKLFIGEATHSGGKALVRGLEHAYDKADILKSNPITYFKGVELERNADIIKASQSSFFGIDYESTAKSVRQDKTYNISSRGPSSYSQPTSFSSKVAGQSVKNSLINGNVSGKSGLSSGSAKSGNSGLSGVSGKSGNSIFSGKSGVSGISGKSGLSGKSNSSVLSGNSGLSGISGISGESGSSGKSGLSGFSGPSSPSGASGVSGSSGFSGLSGISGISGKSGFSGKSGISSRSIAPPSILSPYILGNIGRKRKTKVREGPTGLIHLGTKNVFAPSFNIIVANNKRYEF